MADATLRLLETLRAYGADPVADHRALEAFARLVAAPSPRAADARWIESLARDVLSLNLTRAEAFRWVFMHAAPASDAAHAAPAAARTTGSLALEGLLELDPKGRALLALSCLLGLTDAELAVVVDEAPAVARTILEATVDNVRNAASSRRARDGRAA